MEDRDLRQVVYHFQIQNRFCDGGLTTRQATDTDYCSLQGERRTAMNHDGSTGYSLFSARPWTAMVMQSIDKSMNELSQQPPSRSSDALLFQETTARY